MVHNRLPFLEMLSFMASFQLADHLFEVSAPTAIEGVETKVAIVPKRPELFGSRVIHYRRFDLSEIPMIAVARRNAKTHSDIARFLSSYPLFKYRVFDRRFPSQIAIRYLMLQPADVSDEMLPSVHLSGTTIQLVASPDSDCFIGSLKVSLT